MIVTISREYGAAGRAVTRALAERLGYRLLDDDLPVVVAARLGTSLAAVESVENRTPNFGERLLRSLSTAVPEAFAPTPEVEDLSEATRRAIEGLIRDAAAGGNVVIVGRVANVVLGRRPDLLRVFLYAPLAWRAAHIAQSLHCSEAAARAEIARVDAGRRAYARERYDFEWGDPHQYDLVLDVSTFGVEGSVRQLCAALDNLA